MQDGKHVILCVDDDPDILETLRLALEQGGYVFVGAKSAEEGQRAYEASQPDLLIIDLMMEEVDAGADLVKDLKARGCRAPVYLLSSVGDELNLSVDVHQLGVDGVFQKPLDPNTLLSTLRAKLSQ